MSTFDDFIAAIENATGKPGKRVGRHIRLLCPAHDDHDPSLDVAENGDGKPLTTCRTHGCTYQAICEAIRWEPETDGEWTPHGPAIAIYDYVDAGGALLFQVCRTAGKQFPQRQPDPASKSGWRWNLKGVNPVLYRLPRVLTAAFAGGTVYVCEGEKDVHALERAGVVATCNPGGAGKWRDSYSQTLQGADVVIVADNDEPGLAHASTVAAALAATNNGHARSIRTVRAAEGKDAADHLAAGHTLDELETVDPPPLVLAAPLALTLVEFLALEIPRPPALLGTEDATIIPGGGLVILAGMPGVGKTTLALDLVFHLAGQKTWLTMPVNRPSNILLIENEGPQHKFQDKLRRKLVAWGTHTLQGGLHIQTLNWGAFTFRDPDNIERTRAYLDDNQIDLVIGDPLDTLGPQGVGSPEDTREFVSSLVPLGLTAERSFFFLHHFRKEISANDINQVSGAWGGRLDTLLILREGDKAQELRLSFAKLRHAEERHPMIIGKVNNTLSFEYLNEETPQAPNAVQEVAGQIIEILRKAGGTMERPTLLLRCNLQSNSGTFSRAIGTLEAEGLLAKGKDGRKTIYALAEQDQP